MTTSRQCLAAALLLSSISCGSSSAPTQPSGSTGSSLQATCSATVTASTVGTTAAVTYLPPTVTGGTSPVSVTCTPASGATFPLGTTSVSCIAADAASHQSTCSFNVVVNGVQLSAKKFSAVGDSLTEGENGLPQGVITPQFVDTPNSYPVKLLALLQASYPNQGMTMFSHGVGGDSTANTLAKLPAFLNSDQPDVVLVLSGYNNLTTPCAAAGYSNSACDTAINAMHEDLRSLIRTAKGFPTVRYVFVSNLTPGRSGTRAIDAARIVDANNHIRTAVNAEGAFLVDSYSVFLGHETAYVSTDGLHLLPPGYQAMAQEFFNNIKIVVPSSAPQGIR